ncbi:alpha/beta hydrolase [Aspergillus ruber CBS 135680]|uniref:Alpha/beta-hydrolase n=1 Tax=Aspergillus ruber (strain CBS 135680) TaxID=1388766 RepID=A0A017S5Q1_ASPRC|nr:alpha/beta-hydrolase [Aspergillus ruber CBS 135680]EYE92287.1 alpha/beta-hydrolase [Aspergillus ruber CBS 135680]
MDSLIAQASDYSRFNDFKILTTTYKVVYNHEITVDILYPKHLHNSSHQHLRATPRPVLLRYHGGGLICGHSLFPPFFNKWYLELAQEYSAVIVSPNYRLMPESSILEILGDVEDHWDWMHAWFPAFLENETSGEIKAELGQILAVGDSAGGYLSLQMGLSHPTEIRAVNAVYPMTNPKAACFTGEQLRPVFNISTLPKDTLERHLSNLKEQEALSEVPIVKSVESSPDRLTLCFSICQHGKMGQLLPYDSITPYPLERLDAGARFSRGGVVLLHGRDDTVAPIEQSYSLKEKVEDVDPTLKFRLIVRDGEHGFDHSAKLHDAWLWDAIQDIVKIWLD